MAQNRTQTASVRRAAPRVPLSRERILATALELGQREGLPGLTTRRLASALGCEAMSIYHHYPSKQHLLDAMVEHAVAGVREPDGAADPIARLAFLGREYRAMAQRYPRIFPCIALHRLDSPAGVAFVERMVRHFQAAIPDERLAAQAFRIFGYYVVGAALEETANSAASAFAAEPAGDEFIARECPRLAASNPHFEPAHFESTFETGLAMLLAGFSGMRARALVRAQVVPKPVIRPKA